MPRHAKSRPGRQFLGAIALGAAGAAIVTSAIGYAASSPNGQVQACYDNTTGALRVVGSTPCTGSETAINWAKAGPPGISTLYHAFHKKRVVIPGTQQTTAILTTPALAAGSYLATVNAHYGKPGNATVTCYVARAQHVGRQTFNLAHHEEISPDRKAEWLAETDYVKNIKAGQRITWYCQSGLDPASHDRLVFEGQITDASINAVPVSRIHASIQN